MEETAEEVLARLERYVALRRAQLAVAVDAAAPPPIDTLLPPRVLRPRTRSRPVAETAAQMLAASSCVFAIILFEHLNHIVALAIFLALTIAGIVGIVRHIPLARWWTLGLVIAGLLVRFS